MYYISRILIKLLL